MRRGTRRRWVTALAAIASGGEIIAPKAKAAAQGKPGKIECATHPTTNVVTSTRPIASNAIDAEPVVEIPFSPLGYVIKAHEDGRLGAPGFAEVEVTDVFPGESRDVVIQSASR